MFNAHTLLPSVRNLSCCFDIDLFISGYFSSAICAWSAEYIALWRGMSDASYIVLITSVCCVEDWTDRRQQSQNARLVNIDRWREYTRPILWSQHWLPAGVRYIFKMRARTYLRLQVHALGWTTSTAGAVHAPCSVQNPTLLKLALPKARIAETFPPMHKNSPKYVRMLSDSRSNIAFCLDYYFHCLKLLYTKNNEHFLLNIWAFLWCYYVNCFYSYDLHY